MTAIDNIRAAHAKHLQSFIAAGLGNDASQIPVGICMGLEDAALHIDPLAYADLIKARSDATGRMTDDLLAKYSELHDQAEARRPVEYDDDRDNLTDENTDYGDLQDAADLQRDIVEGR